jgi:hypothetical protein
VSVASAAGPFTPSPKKEREVRRKLHSIYWSLFSLFYGFYKHFFEQTKTQK